jgi:hypothetical protein
MITTAWRDGRCIRVDWNPINPDTAWALVKGVQFDASINGSTARLSSPKSELAEVSALTEPVMA